MTLVNHFFHGAAAAVSVAAVASLTTPSVTSQDLRPIWVTMRDTATNQSSIGRFDRQLRFHGLTVVSVPGGNVAFDTDYTIYGQDSSGILWLPYTAVGPKLVRRIAADGTLLSATELQEFPVQVAAMPGGGAVVLTRVSLMAKCPLYRLAGDGSIAWSSLVPLAPFPIGFPYPDEIAASAKGELWIGGAFQPIPGDGIVYARAARLDPATGRVIDFFMPPGIVFHKKANQSAVLHLEGAGDGTMWMYVTAAEGAIAFRYDGSTLLTSFKLLGGTNGNTTGFRVDAKGHLYAVSFKDYPISHGRDVLYLSGVDGSQLKKYSFQGEVGAFALGPAGDELFVIYAHMLGQRRMGRLHLETGVFSSIPTDPLYPSAMMSSGDPTGFLWANVVDRDGDADGDGVPNGVETSAGTNPYDPKSVPWGPRVYLSWTAAGGLRLRYVDPDGLLSPTGGLSALDLQVEGYGDLLPFFAAYVSKIESDAGFTDVTLEFDGFPIPPNLKLRFEARAMDATGAVGSDWAVSPPGSL